MAELPEAEREGLYQEYQKALASRLLLASDNEESQRLVRTHQLWMNLPPSTERSRQSLRSIACNKVILSCHGLRAMFCAKLGCTRSCNLLIFRHIIVVTFQVQLVYEACHVRLAMLAAAFAPGLDLTSLGSAPAAGNFAAHSNARAAASVPGANQAPEPIQSSAEQEPSVVSHSTLMQVT